MPGIENHDHSRKGPVTSAMKSDIRQKFEASIEKQPNGCWIWRGRLSADGYGKINFNGRNGYAHRLSYLLFKGELPTENTRLLQIDHLCSRKGCVNPDHLELVSAKENCRRGMANRKKSLFGLRVTHCVHGHEYTDANTYWRTLKTGRRKRSCRTCSRAGVNAWKRKRRNQAA